MLNSSIFPTRYDAVASWLIAHNGTLLDIGSRDKILKKHLDQSKINYLSADYDHGGHDYRIDLESKIDLPDRMFDFTTALDVLEHIENTHKAFKEILRITNKTCFISLPNIATLDKRIKFLLTGDLGGKYALMPTHQGDRHRWVTTHVNCDPFINTISKNNGFQLTEKRLIICPGTRLESLMVKLPIGMLKVQTFVYKLDRI